jgi:subtilase family serine protease
MALRKLMYGVAVSRGLVVARAVAMFCLSLSVMPSQAQERQVLDNHVPRAVLDGRAVPVNRVPSTQRLQMAIILQLRNQQQLNQFLQQLYDPNSSEYHKFLTVEQWTERFGPSAQDYQTLVGFLKGKGLNVTDTTRNRMLLDIDASVAEIESLLHVNMVLYQHPTEQRTFYAPDREPSLDLNVAVAHISGLDNFTLPHPKDLRKASAEQAVRANAVGSGPGGSYLGSDMRTAYYGGALTGSGQAVGLFEFGSYNPTDIQNYFKNAGQPLNASIKGVGVNGVSPTCKSSKCGGLEQSVDIEQAISMAPGQTQLIFYTGNNDVDIWNRIASDNIAKQISCSWGYGIDPGADDPIFKEFLAQGQNVFVASGDSGAYTATGGGGQAWPADDPFVVAVGGTDLQATNGAGGSWQTEVGLSWGSGGPSPNNFPIPSWQVGVADSSNQASTTLRNVPDVAMNAQTDFYYCAGGGCAGGVGGTSLSAPLWAGYLALINQQRANSGQSSLGFLNPTIYSIGLGSGSTYNNDFHDITSGNNGYNAATGYDLVTGWGSPNQLIDGLAACPPSTLTPYMQVNGGAWTVTTNAQFGAGGNFSLGPQPLGNGWSWTGPNGFTSTSRQVDFSNVQPNQAGTYIAKYVNSCGAVSSILFTVTVNAEIANGTYNIVDISGYALDDPNGGGAGTGVDQQIYSGTNQQWTVTLVSAGNGNCKITAANGLALTGSTPKAQLILQSYTGANNQLWNFRANGSNYNLINVGTGQAMDDWGGGAGVIVGQWTADAYNANQTWTLGFFSAARSRPRPPVLAIRGTRRRSP